jgi:transposase
MLLDLRGKHTATASELYMAFELGEKELETGAGRWRARTQPLQRDSRRHVLECVAKAKARCGLPPQAKVHSCYEAGRDGFWLHRRLLESGIDNIVVDSASVEVNRRARRTKTDRLDGDKLLAMLIRYHAG